MNEPISWWHSLQALSKNTEAIPRCFAGIPFAQEQSKMSLDVEVPILASAADVAQMLQLSSRTIARMNSSGKLPRPIRLGRSVRFSRNEIQAWIDAGCPNRRTWEVTKGAK
jgi:excisionase family DNA binding protein